MPYSAVTQPRACPLSQGGKRSSSVAVTSTCVSPNFTKQEPSAYFTTPRSSETARSSSGCRRLGRIQSPRSNNDFASLLGGGRRNDKPCIGMPGWTILAPVTEQGAVSQEIPLTPSQAGLAQLNERSREIFRQIVESYLATGE